MCELWLLLKKINYERVNIWQTQLKHYFLLAPNLSNRHTAPPQSHGFQVQFLRSLIAQDHNALSIFTSEFYPQERALFYCSHAACWRLARSMLGADCVGRLCNFNTCFNCAGANSFRQLQRQFTFRRGLDQLCHFAINSAIKREGHPSGILNAFQSTHHNEHLEPRRNFQHLGHWNQSQYPSEDGCKFCRTSGFGKFNCEHGVDDFIFTNRQCRFKQWNRGWIRPANRIGMEWVLQF